MLHCSPGQNPKKSRCRRQNPQWSRGERKQASRPYRQTVVLGFALPDPVSQTLSRRSTGERGNFFVTLSGPRRTSEVEWLMGNKEQGKSHNDTGGTRQSTGFEDARFLSSARCMFKSARLPFPPFSDSLPLSCPTRPRCCPMRGKES